MIKVLIVLILLIGGVYTFQTGSMAVRGTRFSSTRSPLSQKVYADSRSTRTLQMTESGEEPSGPEKKYVYAAGVVIFAVLWDFFITHGGHPYLAHPQ